MKKLMRINTAHVRHVPHDGERITMMSVLVEVTENTKMHNGQQLVEVIDSIGRNHWVDMWFLDDIPDCGE